MKAIIIVDIQNDFTEGGALEVPQGDAVIPIINEIQQQFNIVVATQDWHPPDHKSFASNHTNRKPFDIIDLEGLEQTLWPNHCIQGTRGAAFHDAMDTRRIEAIFRKGVNPTIDSYSGFFDNGHRKSTGLAGYLRERGVQEVFVCGLAGDFCVNFTAQDAIREGFKTFVIEDATRSISAEGFEKAKKTIVEQGGKFIQSKAFKP